MPLIDVSDILTDPDFATTFDVIRSVSTTAITGLASVAQTTYSAVIGVVTSNEGDLLLRQAEGSMIKGSITIHTQFRLTDGQGSNDADEITWNGARYVVSNVNDYSQYGAGFICANADLKPVNP